MGSGGGPAGRRAGGPRGRRSTEDQREEPKATKATKRSGRARDPIATGAARPRDDARTAPTKAVRRPAGPPARLLLPLLKSAYPDAHCALNHRNAYELLVATILSAQCTDVRVNLVTPAFFERYPTPFELARAPQAEVEEIVRSTGFFRNKARNLIGMAQALVSEHGGEVPRTMDALRVLPGVGRKTANVVLGNAFGLNEGVTVDTHVTRLSQLLGLTRNTDAGKIEQDLMPLFPQEDWTLLSHLLISHGREVCVARRPRCGACALAELCPSSLV